MSPQQRKEQDKMDKEDKIFWRVVFIFTFALFACIVIINQLYWNGDDTGWKGEVEQQERVNDMIEHDKQNNEDMIRNLESKVDSPVDSQICSLESVLCKEDIDEQGAIERPVEAKIEAQGAYFAVVTAYSEYDSCHTGATCLMANGIKAQEGYAACPRAYSLGTKVEIEGYGNYICGDRTASWVDGRFDIFTGYGDEGYNEAIAFGKRTLKVTIL